jgi:molybdopterin-guanine dinucleotide biosynthesis protein A
MERLYFVTDFHDELKKSKKPVAVMTREKNIAAAEASRDILRLAHAMHVRSGKWMLFCSADTVNETWDIVARATAVNQLGVAAKVATSWNDKGQRTEQLICVYTADFADTNDVKRVALELKQLGLVHARGRPIYYKPGQNPLPNFRVLSFGLTCS